MRRWDSIQEEMFVRERGARGLGEESQIVAAGLATGSIGLPVLSLMGIRYVAGRIRI